MLIFPYTLENQGPVDVYAAHALASGAAAKETAAVVVASDSGDAIVGKFAAPRPTDRVILAPLAPLARLLPKGATLEGRIEITLPLAETSPYFPDLTLRQYEIVEIKGVVVTIGYWSPETYELVARPSADAPDLLTILAADPAAAAKRASQRFPTSGLQLFKRTDGFPRTMG